MTKETIGLLIVILLLTGSLFAITQNQQKQIDSLTRTIEIMADMQSNTTQWLSDVHELAADNALRIARQENE
jgi:cell division protein FtsX